MGRRKIEIKMVKDANSRQVTFSKRRAGVFKKANELATLCGAKVAIIVFSPGGKPFSYGHPNVEMVVERFLNQEPKQNEGNNVGSSKDNRELDDLNRDFVDILKRLHVETRRGKMIQKQRSKCKAPLTINELSRDELLKLKKSLEGLSEKIKMRANEMEASSSLLLLAKEPVNG